MPAAQKKTRNGNEVESEFKEFVNEISGTEGLRVVGSIGDGATDEKIEKETKLKLSEIRALLNTLQNYGVVEYSREKNMTTGWFTYTWRINASRALQKKLANARNEYASLCRESSQDSAVIYKCPTGCSRMLFDHAMDSGFACPTCQKKLKYADGSKEIKDLAHKISALENVLQAQLRAN